MPLPITLDRRNYESFTQTLQDETARRVITSGAVPSDWDRIDLAYTGNNLTLVEYYSGGQVIRTLTLQYTGNNLTRVDVS